MKRMGMILPSYNRYGKVNGVDLTIVGEPLYWFPNRRMLIEFAESHEIELITEPKTKNNEREPTQIRGIGWRDPDFGPTTYKTKYGRRSKKVTRTYLRK